MWRVLHQSTSPPVVHTVRIGPSGRELLVASNQSILEAALAEGLPWPHNCKAGICHSCRCQLEQGEVYVRRDKTLFMTPEEPEEPNTILACQSEPRSDLRVHVDARGNRPIA
nr:(2Fe-2S)-binding protein [Oceanococcus sp. HetDA_MAG_MS8]